MSSYEQQHNVSVRLNDTHYNQLLQLHDKFNRMSYGKVSLADVLRIAVQQLHMIEMENQNQPVTEVTEVRKDIASFVSTPGTVLEGLEASTGTSLTESETNGSEAVPEGVNTNPEVDPDVDPETKPEPSTNPSTKK